MYYTQYILLIYAIYDNIVLIEIISDYIMLYHVSVIVSGTSASSPVFAGMVALVNSARRANGNSTLGWLNPALYSLSSSFVNDITSGDNRCLASGGCCSQGFYASVGWDPVTGLGSVNFENFKAAMLGIEPTAGVIDQGSSSKKQWVLTSGYKKEDCPGSSNLVTQTGYPIGECIIQYNNNKQPEYSVEYGCTDDEGTVCLYVYNFYLPIGAYFTLIIAYFKLMLSCI